ncbi:MAG: hypothetical protein J0H01_18010 [Rhizobiales bacterium]|nr:hypothetical protein [Hyphomicrobiales bacterium]
MIDGLLIALLLQLVAVIAFPLTDSRIRGALGISYTGCQPLRSLPAGIEISPNLQPNFARDCTASLFGLVTARWVTVGRQTRSGNVTTTVSTSFALDAQGKPTRGFDLNLLVLPLFLLLRWWGDQGRGSPGRRFFGMQLIAKAANGLQHPAPKALAKRYVIFAAPAVIGSGLYVALVNWGGGTDAFSNPTTDYALFGLAILTTLAYVWPITAIVRRRDTFYDNAAGTAVMRVPAPDDIG